MRRLAGKDGIEVGWRTAKHCRLHLSKPKCSSPGPDARSAAGFWRRCASRGRRFVVTRALAVVRGCLATQFKYTPGDPACPALCSLTRTSFGLESKRRAPTCIVVLADLLLFLETWHIYPRSDRNLPPRGYTTEEGGLTVLATYTNNTTYYIEPQVSRTLRADRLIILTGCSCERAEADEFFITCVSA